MEGRLLVSGAHLSSLFPGAEAACYTINTANIHAPLPTISANDSNPEHALHGSVLYTPTTGTVLLRVLHSGLILELSSLSFKNVDPIRFLFPAKVLSAPAFFLWETDDLHLLAVTDQGSLYRIIIPIRARLWADARQPHSCTEYIIKTIDKPSGTVHVHGTHCVAIGLPNGSLLRLETEQLAEDGLQEQWVETVHHHTSFLSSFLPTRPTPGHDIISMATHPWPTDIGHVWTLSRDRTLRFWKARDGCVSSKVITVNNNNNNSTRELTPNGGSQPNVLLDAERQTLVRVFSDDQDNAVYLLVFIPSPSSSTSGGTFQIVSTHHDSLQDVRAFDSPTYTARCQLQDYMVLNRTLYTLWDDQGQSTLVSTPFTSITASSSTTITPQQWLRASYPDSQSQTLNPTHIEQILLPKGSLPSKFLAAITHPGTFSPLTLTTALTQYTSACLSLPTPTGVPHPPQLTATYPTVAEHIAAVVGCTVSLMRNTHTGALLHAQYWNALKRDWEGFVARCREVERSARWPLVLGVSHQLDASAPPPTGTMGGITILVVERERVGCLAPEDLPLSLKRILTAAHPPVENKYELLGILWNLRGDLGVRAVLSLEDRLVDILHQEIAFSIPDILKDQARRLGFLDPVDYGDDQSEGEEEEVEGLLDPGLKSWIQGRLASVGDIEVAVRTTLDVVGGFDVEVKREEEEDDEMALDNEFQQQQQQQLQTTTTEWKRAITAAYLTHTINARCDICLSLMIVLFVLADTLDEWEDRTLLAEVFAVFRGVAMLRTVAKQAAGETTPNITEVGEEVTTRLRNMHVSQLNDTTGQFTPTHSLLHRLLATYPPSSSSSSLDLPSSVHRFLESCGLLQAASPAHATQFEVSFCERLRRMGYVDVAGGLLGWLPRTPGVVYCLARVWIDSGKADEAVGLLEKIAVCFGPDAYLLEDEAHALAALLPAGELFESEYDFHVHAAALFRPSPSSSSHSSSAALVGSSIQHQLLFAQLAISSAPSDVDTEVLWGVVISGYMNMGLWEDAYAALVSSPYEKQKREAISQLVYRMCEEDAVERLMAFNFAGFADEVEGSLSFKARNVDPRIRPFYSRILYTWYVLRGDYRSAALVMYQRARRLQDLMDEPASVLALAEDQMEAYMVAINALSLLEKKSAWFVLPVLPDHSHEPRKRRKLTRHIPEDKYSAGTHDAEIIDLADVQYDYALLSARIDLVRGNPSALASGEFLLPATSIVMRLAQSNRFNMAMATARSLDVDMTEVFANITSQCLKLSHNPAAVLQEDTSDWLLTDKVSSWPGTAADRGWRYLRQSLERHDSAETDYRYTKATLETILAFDRTTPPPPWLVASLEANHHEYLIRTCLRYEVLEYAMEHTLSMMKKADSQLTKEPPKNASATWLPYALFDQLLAAAASQADLSARGQSLRQELQTVLANRIKCMQRIKL